MVLNILRHITIIIIERHRVNMAKDHKDTKVRGSQEIDIQNDNIGTYKWGQPTDIIGGMMDIKPKEIISTQFLQELRKSTNACKNPLIKNPLNIQQTS